MKASRKEVEGKTTYAMKKIEDDSYDVWDGLLNEVYGSLKKQLPAEEMDQLRKQQRKWLDTEAMLQERHRSNIKAYDETMRTCHAPEQSY
ncbi:DUF1311 domain-containing protein [Lentibacillus lipolyticus]|nr:DUF1311 domain-containing protein [Lentibacillus lipolyticus]